MEKHFDPIRGRWVELLPEELIRQQLMFQLIECGYPRSMIAVEKELKSLPHLKDTDKVPNRRLDLLIYAKLQSTTLLPLLIIECKRTEISHLALERAFDQLISYNHYVKAPFVALAGKNGFFLAHYDSNDKRYHFSTGIPPYHELIKWIVA